MPLAACFLSLRDILRALEFLIAQIHSFRMSRKNAANWGRFPKSVIFGRARDYIKSDFLARGDYYNLMQITAKEILTLA